MVKLYENEVVTKHEFEMINITNEVKKAVADSGIKNGMVAVITKHTTTGIMINEALPCVEKDRNAAGTHCSKRFSLRTYPYASNLWNLFRKCPGSFKVHAGRKSLYFPGD